MLCILYSEYCVLYDRLYCTWSASIQDIYLWEKHWWIIYQTCTSPSSGHPACTEPQIPLTLNNAKSRLMTQQMKKKTWTWSDPSFISFPFHSPLVSVPLSPQVQTSICSSPAVAEPVCDSCTRFRCHEMPLRYAKFSCRHTAWRFVCHSLVSTESEC